jgi:hypothetical protein
VNQVAPHNEERKRRSPLKAGAKPTLTKAPISTLPTIWPVAGSLKVDRSAIPGRYILRLDDGGADSPFVPLTI